MAGKSEVSPSVARGLQLALRGVKVALGSAEVRKTYVRLALVLVLLAFALSGALIWLVWFLVQVTPDMSWWTWIGYWSLRLGGALLALIAAPMLALFVVNVVFPFLADAVFMAGVRARDPALAARLEKVAEVGFVSSVMGSVRRLVYFVGVTLGLVMLSLVPVVGPVVGPALELWFAARMLSWELLDPYFERVGTEHAAQRRLVATQSATLAGYGLPWTFVMALPGIGPLLFGLAQAGIATLVVEDLEAQM